MKCQTFVYCKPSRVGPMDLDDEIHSRIRSAKSLSPGVKDEDFQIRAGENGSVLINLKTGKAQLVYDDDSELHDLEDLHVSLDGKNLKTLG
jgi:hypothetical protein